MIAAAFGGPSSSSSSSAQVVHSTTSGSSSSSPSSQSWLIAPTTAVRCLWAGCTFSSPTYDVLFAMHLMEHANSAGHASRTCLVAGCSRQVDGTHEELRRHLSVHLYHIELQLKGHKIMMAENLCKSRCGFEAQNFFDIDGRPLRCQWHSCGATFDLVTHFVNFITCKCFHKRVGVKFTHINQHVTASEDRRCCWSGCTFSHHTKSGLRRHVWLHSGEKIVGCPLCGALFGYNIRLSEHLMRRKPEGDDNSQQSSSAVSCEFCSKTFPDARLLRRHAQRHVRSLQCPNCKCVVSSPNALRRHMQNCSRVVRHGNITTPAQPQQAISQDSASTFIAAMAASAAALFRPPIPVKEPTPPENVSSTTPDDEGPPGPEHLYACHICPRRYTRGHGLSRHLESTHSFPVPYSYKRCPDGLLRLQTSMLLSNGLAALISGAVPGPSTSN